MPNRAFERQPHPSGTASYHYRYGTAVGISKFPSQWGPEMQHDQLYLYEANQYAKDVREWVVATDAVGARQGRVLTFALGGAARQLFDGM